MNKGFFFGVHVCVCVCVREAYSLHFSVSRSSDSCFRAFSVSPTTASTPFSCMCVCQCVCVCTRTHVCVGEGESGLSYYDIKPKVKWEERGRENVIPVSCYSPHSRQDRWNCAYSALICRHGDCEGVAREEKHEYKY